VWHIKGNEMAEMQSVKIKADVMWAQLDKANEMSSKFQVVLTNLSEAAVVALEEMGITVAEKEGQGRCITCKSSIPIKAFDNDGVELSGVKIGNGSKAKAIITAYEWKYKNKKGVSPSLKKLVITDLIEYGGGSADLDDDEVL
jgi:hypothetical protein